MRLQRLLASRRVYSGLAEVAGVDCSQQAVQVLRAVADGGPQPVAAVARAARMDMGAVSRQLRALQDQGMIARTTSPTNGSVVLVEATAAGLDAARRIERVRGQHLHDALRGWSDPERHQLGALLVRLVDDLQRTPYRAGAVASSADAGAHSTAGPPVSSEGSMPR